MHELKQPFQSSKNILFCRSFSNCTQKLTVFTNQKVIYFQKALRVALKSRPILQTKNFPFEQAFPCYSQKPAFFAPKAFLLQKPFFIAIPSTPFPPSTSHSHPAITYCPPKNTAILSMSALTPYAVKPEPRTDSKPFRHCFVRKTRFDTCRRKILQEYFRQSFESRSQDGVVSPHMVALLTSVRNSPCFGGLRRTKTCHWQLFARPSMLFGYFLHAAKSDNPPSLAGRDSRFCKPRISTPKLQLHTSPIKSFAYFL